MLLRLPQDTFVTSAAILQRFFFRRSMADFDVRVAAAAALLLASKLQDNERRLKHIIAVFYRLHLRASETVRHSLTCKHLQALKLRYKALKRLVFTGVLRSIGSGHYRISTPGVATRWR